MLCIFCNTQAQRFQATTGTPNPDEKWATVEDAATNRYVSIGNVTVANVAGGAVLQQLWISSYNKVGVVQSSARASNSRRMIARDISLAPNDAAGNRTYFVTGYTVDANGVSKMFIGRIYLTGAFAWYVENPVVGNGVEGVAITTAPNGDAVAAGNVSWPNAPVSSQIILTRIPAIGGAITWSRVYNVAGTNWIVREINNGSPIPNFINPVNGPNGYFVVTGEARYTTGAAGAVVTSTFVSAYNGAGAEGWKNIYPEANAAIVTVADAGYDVVVNSQTGNYNVAGVAQMGANRAAATSTPYLLEVNSGGSLVNSAVYTNTNNQPLGLYPRCIENGRNAGQTVFAGPDFANNKTFYGTVNAIGGAATLFNYAGLATANSTAQPFIYYDGPREDIVGTTNGVNQGYLITTNALPVGAFGAGDGHFIRTDINGQTPANCTNTAIQSAPSASINTITKVSVTNQVANWVFQPTVFNANPVQQQFCRNIIFIVPDFNFVPVLGNVAFKDTSTGNGALSYFWDFGDGTNSTIQHPTHNYANSGSYNVCLRVTNTLSDGDTASAIVCKQVAVNLCTIKSKFTYTVACKYKVSYTATSTGTGPFMYYWLFDDGTTSALANPVKTYTACGTHVTRLITCNTTCCDTIFQTVDIPCCLVKSDFCLQDSGLYVKLMYTTTMNLPTTTYSVYVDGVLTTWTANAYKALTAGIHTICLKARRVSCPGDTCCTTCCKTISVHANCTLFADFWHQEQTNGNVLFTNKSAPAGYSSVWDFGDGSPTVTTTSPSHIYTTPGTYMACLTVTIVSGTDTCRSRTCKTILIETLCKPLAKFKSKYCIATPLTVEFINYSSGATTYVWDLGDGNSSILINPVHTYAATGTYIVCLTAYASTGCWSRTCYRVVVSSTSCDVSCSMLPPNPTVKLGNNLILPGEILNNMTLQESVSNTNETMKDNINVLKVKPQEIKAEDKLSLFPNPASQKVQVVFETATEAPGEVTVTNALGSLVYRKPVTMVEGKNQFSVPLQSVANGTYFLRVLSGNKIHVSVFSVKN